MDKLIQARIKAFLVQAGVLVVIAVGGVILSADFKELVTQNFGTGFATSSIMLFLTGLVSHILNKLALKKLGSSEDEAILI